ncbi:MAG: glycosyltransferase family 39 protein [Paracoccaceae bacterium]
MPEQGSWLPRAALWVGLITAARIAALWFNKTDLYVDESQYWFWGQRLDFGYYSKPPLIAWVIRTVTALAGSDAPFWIRLPGSLFHAATALILAALGARLFSARAAFWVAVSYVTLPMAALGSLLISTDTIMAPFFAAALYFHFRSVETGRAVPAALAGLMVGMAFLAKYAAVYFLLGGALAALFLPSMRIPFRNAILMAAVFALTILPNVLWNIGNDLSTIEHTMDNVGWLRGQSWLGSLNPAGLGAFLASQLAVLGPVLFAALIWGWARREGAMGRALTWFSLPVLVIVSIQALLSGAYGNWAIAAYFAGVLIAVSLLLTHAPAFLNLSLGINGLISLALPVLTIIAPVPEWNGRPLLERYLGQDDLSRQIITAARDAGATVIVARDRDVLADLFRFRDGFDIYAPDPVGRPGNYYEQNFPLPRYDGPVLLVASRAPVCDGSRVAAFRQFEVAGGAYERRGLAAFIVPAGCVDAKG